MSDLERIELDSRVVEALYGSLEKDSQAALVAELEDSEQAEALEDIRGIQKLFAVLPDEEPPPALSAKLLGATRSTHGRN